MAKNSRVRNLAILVLVFNIMTISIVNAQDVTWASDEEEWESPEFTPGRSTRIEWRAYPSDVTTPRFSILVIEVGVGIVEERTGLEGIGNLDNFADRPIRLNILAVGIRIWEIRLFSLVVQPTSISTTTPPVTTPLTTTPPVTTPSTTTPLTPTVTQLETVTIAEVTTTQVITVRNEIPVTTTIALTTYTQTIAVYTELPKGASVVTFSFTFLVIGFLLALLVVVVLVLKKYTIISLMRKEDFEDPEVAVSETSESTEDS